MPASLSATPPPSAARPRVVRPANFLATVFFCFFVLRNPFGCSGTHAGWLKHGRGGGESPQGRCSRDADILKDSATGIPPAMSTPRALMWAPQNTPNALASAQDLPIPERLPDITAAATRRLGEPASGFKHDPSSSSPSQAPQVREMNLLSPPYLRWRRVEEDGPLGEPSLMDDNGVLRAQANLLAPPHLRRSVRLGHAIQHLHQAALS